MHVLLDACVALNLEAAGEFDAIADVLGLTFVMSTKVAEETFYLDDIIDGEPCRIQIDLGPHIRKGTLGVHNLTPGDETATFVRLAGQVDDGEAECLALAVHRALPFATDDRLAIRVAGDLGLTTIFRTAELLRRYADRANLRSHDITLMLGAVERRASFRPPRSSPDYSWWLGHSSPSDH
ncbi:hypothetical protein ACIHFD_60915 [Nonomuraea sp. NPDC051941]|uniref:hypothetical protein n=1 Tax=Nonomuraea sp. NPDC051941 TaxID=3364373 RepID=UPI0037CBB5AF